MEFNIYLPVRLITGENCIKKYAYIFSDYGKRCLIVTGGKSATLSGAFADVSDALRAEGIEYEVFDKITENPLCSAVIEGGAAARDFGADFIIGIGGGSPLDASKAIAICAENPDFDIDGLYNRKIPAKALPLVLIGTTSGTGSEVTGVSVLTNDNNMIKKSISGTDCYSAVSFLEPKYTFSMPYPVTVSTALDAFAHSVEGWFSQKCGVFPSIYAEMALPAIFEGLKFLRCGELPEKEMREKLYYGSVFAGLQLNICGAAFPHTIGYALTEEFGIPHGKACTAFMPFFLRKAKAFMPERYEKLLKILSCSEDELIETVRALTDVKIKADEKAIDKICSRWEQGNKNFDNSPGGFNAELAREAFKEISE